MYKAFGSIPYTWVMVGGIRHAHGVAGVLQMLTDVP